MAVVAHAAPADRPDRPDVVRQCADPKPGAFSCFALRRTDVAARKGVQPLATTPDGFGPGDLQSAYALPADGGAGETVAIVDAYDDPNAEADLAVYRQQFGLPACTTANGCFSKVSQRGGTDYPTPDPDWSGEISLDVDMVSAIAPNAHILLVEADSANFADLGAAVDEAVALGAKYVSNSYGTGYDSTPGSGEDPSELTAMDPYYNHPGVAVVASSGDDGYGVSYPAASQYVTSVGGTALTRAAGTSRGWSESVWNNAYGGPGSGCSLYEPKPAFQTDTICGKRALTDVSAVADPVTGVSVYQTYGGGGWAVYGGTSASSPIIAAVYASAGTPTAGSYPNAYPYTQRSALNDVTAGDNGTCTPAALCTAGPGYDGPTGLGTPNGLTAFRSGPHGVISGTVTDHATGAAIAGATVKAGDYSATSDAAGAYKLDIPPGSYDVTASAYGYGSATDNGVALADGATVTESFALDAVPRQTVSGKITDGSGHGWPLYAKITADGVPGGPVFTDPVTGAYSLTLPQNTTYTLHVASNYPGYQTVDKTVQLGAAGSTLNVAVPVDADAAQAPGYAVHLSGPTEPFTATTGPPAGWSVSNAAGTSGGWAFDDQGSRGNRTGGSGGFAMIDSDHLGQGQHQDSRLLSPSYDLSGAADPILGFDTDYKEYSNSTADVDVSADGGTTWTTLWHRTTTSVTGPAHVQIPLTGYAGKSDVRLRFHYTGTWAYWWELDNVFVGQRSYDPVPGGLIVGNVTDANTKTGVNGATVTSADSPADHTTTAATPDDPNLGDGFYWTFSHVTGKHPVSAAASHYTTVTATANIPPDGTAGRDISLKAGRLKVTPASIANTVAWGKSATQTVTVKNTGTAPATLTLGENPGGVVIQQKGAPLNLVKGTYSPLSLAAHGSSAGAKSAAGRATTNAAASAQGAAGTAWQTIPDLPVSTGDNAVATYQGTVYSAFGYTGVSDTSDLYAYSADSGAWTKLASAADTREAPAHGIVNGKLYAAGGWGASGAPDAKLEIYDIASGTWSTGAGTPKPYAGSGSAVLDGKLYAVGGCTATACGTTDVTAYDPGTNTWASVAAYPEPVSWESCGGIAGKLYCSGGTTDAGSITHAYVYDPAADSWSPIADQPTDAWGASYTAANGVLLVKGGAVQAGAALSNQTWAYQPEDNTWTALPNANASLYRGGGGVGFYSVGGMAGTTPNKAAEVLPGYDQTESADVTWLSESTGTVTVQPGASATVTVTLDASVPEITQPGVYSASLSLGSDTPYRLDPIGVALTVKPPATWGKITGTVTASGGAPIAGATVQITTWATHYTLKTGTDGSYQLWLDVRNNPLQLIVAKDGYQPTVTTVKIAKGATTTQNFTLLKD
ncbi:carboxypeptidase regulatory-like domain-containing protein [Actinacidiphila acidipaludis]|uniref:Carboxypeptidase regulatory-like domain-containing protein n=1 Tax=Actinacidiphila acidipaludis TaxID=2873382 RepID=A0ABS7QDN9_9ACTN|nr:carboxypeptidase regulatory-like domain-containing protein [Streptomyces acidipaludis]MBY8880530.1 carboxypeptidase regulatory-like domain-containing protein [Streptomyces acidipaludis]